MTMQQNRAQMPGPLLCSGKLGDFRPLGALGRTVLSAAPQIRTGIRRQVDAQAAEMLAIPQVNESGDTVDWYAPVAGPVVPWSAGTDEERHVGTLAAKALRARLVGHSESLLAGNPRGDAEVFARLVSLAPLIPAESFIYLVGGKPVLTYWGFHPLDAGPGFDVIHDLPSSAAAVPPSVVMPAAAVVPPEPQRSWWQWLWWLLGLLLATLLVLLLLRSCGLVPPGIPGFEAPRADIQAPDLSLPRPDLALPSPVPVPASPLPLPSGTLPDLHGESLVVPDGTPDIVPGDTPAEAPALPGPQPQPEETQPEETPPEETPPEETQPEETPPEETPASPPPAPVPGQPEEPPPVPGLTIPEEALATGAVDFLDGRWRSRTSLMDSQTGRPLDVEYEFHDGEGTSTIRRSDGIACEAPMQAQMNGDTLELVQTAPAACPDGTAFDPSRIECAPDPAGRARCRGIHGSGEEFLVDIVQ